METYRRNLELQRGRMRGEIDWKFKIDMCRLLYLKQNAFHETITKAMQVGQIKRWSIFCLRHPMWCHLPHEALCLRVKSVQSRPTLCKPMTLCSSLGSSVHGILQARILEWVAIPFSRGPSWPKGPTQVSHVSCTGRQILYHWPIGEAPSTFSSCVHWGCWGSSGRNKTTRSPSVWTLTLTLTQPRGTDNDSTRIGSKAFSSSVTPTTFQVLRSIMWPGAMVLDRADI